MYFECTGKELGSNSNSNVSALIKGPLLRVVSIIGMGIGSRLSYFGLQVQALMQTNTSPFIIAMIFTL